ncbi:hypothetical protein [Krasilnikovia sp. M28-CT-15]|uniref:hypothetical protein n=1 Tax=Krasilnikovia sp. M28-CT-15 TaxID=3373540 RepID=UPI0038767C5D
MSIGSVSPATVTAPPVPAPSGSATPTSAPAGSPAGAASPATTQAPARRGEPGGVADAAASGPRAEVPAHDPWATLGTVVDIYL